MKTETVKLSQIQVNGANPRTIKDDKFAKLVNSILVFPQMLELRPIVVTDTHVALGGNMRYRALTSISDMSIADLKARLVDIRDYQKKTPTEQDNLIAYWERWQDNPTAPIIKAAELSDEQQKEFIIKDNVGYGEWDYDMLANDWDSEDLDDWGLDVWQNETQEHSAIDEDEAPEVDTKSDPKTKIGDIWQLGRHRLMCGDSTDKATVEMLMDGKKADIAFSSPPYNAGTTPTEKAMVKNTKYNGNDDNKSEAEYIEFLNAYIEQAMEHSEYVFMNVQSISNNKLALIDVLYHNKEIYADTIIWDKIHGQPAMAENVMNSVFEYVHIFSKKANRAVGTVQFRGTVDNILHLQSQRNNEYSNIHNATFSVEFASHFIQNFAKKSVLDQFGGTGTTLITCEQLDRTCYMMELDPKYCDVILKRWEDVTGEKATLVGKP